MYFSFRLTTYIQEGENTSKKTAVILNISLERHRI